MKKLFSILLLFVIALGTNSIKAQENIIKSLERDVPGQGKVTIHQSAKITELVGYVGAPSENNIIKRPGYRVQLFAGSNNRNSKNQAYEMAAKAKEMFPELKVYTMFIPPRWVCKVGDYKSMEEANVIMRQLLATDIFKEVLIIKDQINIPL